MGRLSGALLAIGLVLLPASAAGAQATANRGDSATIYRDSGFRGPAVAVGLIAVVAGIALLSKGTHDAEEAAAAESSEAAA